MTDREPLTLVVGRIVKPHGIRGEVVVDVRTDSPEDRFGPGMVLGVQRQGARRPEDLTLVEVRPHSGRLLARIDGVDTRESAEELRGALLTVRADALEAIGDPNEFYDFQLEGLRVVHTAGYDIGVLHEVVHTPGGELLVVHTDTGRELLVPFVSEIVPEVNLEAGRVVVDPPEGLFDQ
jgi:16S rRNA processing protein RimM